MATFAYKTLSKLATLSEGSSLSEGKAFYSL